MVYNRQYNTRNSTGRYNTSGQFVAAGAQQQQQQQQQAQYQQQQQYQPQPPQFQPPPPPPPQPQQQYPRNVQTINTQQQQFPKQQQDEAEMKPEPDTDMATSEDSGSSRPFWMKSKLGGLKKISNREKRRRQNAHLRRLITPKNALMVLNEMLPHDQLATTLQQFTVEPAEGMNQYYKSPNASFCADLTLDGVNYKGYGETKIMARNAAAEQAIRDLIIRRMHKAVTHDADAADKSSQSGEAPQKEEEVLPMIQLASYALHKLFSEWEYDGHKVPQLRVPSSATSEMEVEGEAGDECASVASSSRNKNKSKKPPKTLPLNAPAMHPCMLLTYMRSNLEYREVSVDGPGAGSSQPQFTMSVDVDGVTYIGKAANKKEARKAAARSACTAIFGVRFDDVASANVPLLPPSANASASANANASASANTAANANASAV